MSKHLTLNGLQTILPPIKHLIDKKAESWDDLKGKPFGSEIKEAKLIDNISITLTDLYEDGTPAAALPSFGLNEGSIYSVIYDGLTYECKCFACYETLAIGNLGLSGEASTTNEPFLIFGNPWPEVCGETLNTTHTLSITGQVEIITKLPEKYLDMPKGILTTSNYLETTAGMQKGAGEVFNNYNTNIADGYMAHAEGSGTVADGAYSHAEGCYTYASQPNQHAQGKYNIIDTKNQYAHIVGNGISRTSRSNTHTLDWSGNAWYQGDVYVGGTSQDDAAAEKLVKQSELEAAVTNLPVLDNIVLKDSVTGAHYTLYIANGEIMIKNEVVE